MVWRSFIVVSLLCTCHAATLKPPPYFSIGGLFDTFAVENSSLEYVRQDAGSQYLAAFVMAVDEINNKIDGIHDDLLPNTKIRLICEIGVSILALYPPNNFVYGAGRAYILRLKDSSLVATVDGSSNDDSTSATAQTLNNWGVLSLISRSTSADYAHSDSFPLTLQNTPSKTSEAFSLVHLTSRFNWDNVAVFFIYDTKIGLDSTVAYQSALPYFGVNLLGSYPIKTGQTNFDLPISQAVATGATIFAFFLDGGAAGQLLEQGYNAGLFHDGTQVLATSTSDLKDIRAAFTPAGLLNEAKILKGFITTAPHPEYYFSTPLGQAFISRFRNLPPSMRVDPSSGTRSCNTRSIVYPNGSYTARDNENTERFRNITTELCLGFESFKSFNANGTNIDPSILYTYDSVYMYVTAASNLIMQKRPINAASLYDYMTSSLFTSLVTGYAFFIPGRGTRAVGNVFKVLNYQPSAPDNEYSGNGLAYIGEFTDATGWLLCGNTQDMSKMPSTSGSQCTPPVYRMIPETSQPLDAPPVRIEQLPSNVRISLIVLASFGLMTLAVWGTCLCAFWRRKIIRTAQPQIMVFLLIGGVMGLVKVLLSAADVTNETCLSQMWLSHFAFRLIFRTLLLKLWRINGVVNAARFKRIIIPESTVLWYLLSDLVFMTFALLIPITIISSLKNGMVGYVSSTVANQVTLYIECQVSLSLDLQILNAILYFSDGLNLIMAVYYTYLTRTVPVNVNETSTVAPGELELESESSP
jgi:Receptor family ligand binding region/7 transmembrane sweet-taste receptor of 3 GCPR